MEKPSLNDKQRRRLMYSLRDLTICSSVLYFLGECEPEGKYSKEDVRRFRCYQDTAIISYWRPFSRSPSIPALDFRWIEIEPTEREIRLHKHMKVLRDKIVAHSDEDFMRFSFNALDFGVSNIRFPYLHFDEGIDLIDLRFEIREWVLKLIFGLTQALFDIAQNMEMGSQLIQDGKIPDDPASDPTSS